MLPLALQEMFKSSSRDLGTSNEEVQHIDQVLAIVSAKYMPVQHGNGWNTKRKAACPLWWRCTLRESEHCVPGVCLSRVFLWMTLTTARKCSSLSTKEHAVSPLEKCHEADCEESKKKRQRQQGVVRECCVLPRLWNLRERMTYTACRH